MNNRSNDGTSDLPPLPLQKLRELHLDKRTLYFQAELMSAICFGNIGKINSLLEKKEDLVNDLIETYLPGGSPYFQEISSHLEVFHDVPLKYYSIEVNFLMKDKFSFVSPLHVAAEKNRVEAVKLFLTKNNKIDLPASYVSPTGAPLKMFVTTCDAMDFAVSQNHVEVFKLLLDKYGLTEEKAENLMFTALNLEFKEIAALILNYKNYKDLVWDVVLDPTKTDMFKFMIENSKGFCNDILKDTIDEILAVHEKERYDYNEEIFCSNCKETIMLLFRAGYGIFAKVCNFEKVVNLLDLFNHSNFELSTFMFGMEIDEEKVSKDHKLLKDKNVITDIPDLILAIESGKKLNIDLAHFIKTLNHLLDKEKAAKERKIKFNNRFLVRQNINEQAAKDRQDKKTKLTDSPQVETQSKKNRSLPTLKTLSIAAIWKTDFFHEDSLKRKGQIPEEVLSLFSSAKQKTILEIIEIKNLLEKYLKLQEEKQEQEFNSSFILRM